MHPIKIAITKGRLENNSINMFKKLGYDCKHIYKKGRKLIVQIYNYKNNDKIKIVFAKAVDVITYVEAGVCDIGIVGKDVIMEKGGVFYEVTDLKFGKCNFVLATLKGKKLYNNYKNLIIASKYVNITKNYFEKKNINVDIIKIEGSVELAPVLGLADAIIDIVETGITLKENGLVIIEKIYPTISARLIVNIASMKLKKRKIENLINKIENNI